MQYGRLSILQPLGILIDLFCLNLAFVGAYFIIYHQIEGCFSPPYLVLFWVFNITWALTLLALRPSIEPRMTFNFYKLTYNFLILLINSNQLMSSHSYNNFISVTPSIFNCVFSTSNTTFEKT
jgi:hypothetical protein